MITWLPLGGHSLHSLHHGYSSMVSGSKNSCKVLLHINQINSHESELFPEQVDLMNRVKVSYSLWTGTTKCHRQRGLNNRYIVFPVLETAKSKGKIWYGSVSVETSLPGSKMASYCTHMVERGKLWFLPLLLRAKIYHHDLIQA